MVEPTPLTVQLLKEIRDEVRGVGVRLDGMEQRFEGRFEKMDQRFEKMDQRFEKMDQRFEIIETSLRDMSQQLIILARGVKVAIRNRKRTDDRLDEHERRLTTLERKDE